MKAVVIGGSGATGRELVLQLLADYRVESVVALVRKPFFMPDPKLKEVIVDFDHLEQYAAFIDADVAFSTLGTTLKQAGSKKKQWRVDYEYQLKFAQLARMNHVFTFVLLSSAQASPKSKFFYSRMKGMLEEKIKQLDFPKLIILRSGLIDRPKTDRRGEKIALKVIKVFNALGILKNYKPISTVDLAKVIVDRSFDNSEDDITILEPKEILS
ncbi:MULTISPECIES: NAD(P)H-binding protein [Sphingobacterium]|uniref:NAD(P)H-binding protein n=1 Tax=Sphingobacterium tenebrionis TaxID=3111775 RepID=A0ABU8I662_9SPHI|nr:NAD(P)H-binding protein [Sphingobacterium sp. CZ-2]QBR11419.1 NAD-dependent epimerase/dehydratase family protein [Sphingobacterium sp. CZ-2]